MWSKVMTEADMGVIPILTININVQVMHYTSHSKYVCMNMCVYIYNIYICIHVCYRMTMKG